MVNQYFIGLFVIFQIFVPVILHPTDDESICSDVIADDYASCCQLPKLLYDKQDTVEKCKKHLDMHTDDMEKLNCFAECIFNETDPTAKNGEFNFDSFKTLLTDSLKGDKEWLPIVGEAANKCKAIDRKPQKTGSCYDIYFLYFKCIDIMMFTNCPASQRMDSERCKKLRKDAEKCFN